MPVLLPALFLLVQAALLALAPPAVARPAAYLSMLLAPLLAAAAVLRRSRLEPAALRGGWWAVAASLVLWAVGAFDNLWQELILGRQNEMYRTGMIAFSLASMPTAYVLAGEGSTKDRKIARLIDAAVAAALGYAIFLFTWITLTAHPDAVSVKIMVFLLDALNAYIAAGAVVRCFAASDRAERDLFGVITAYMALYAVVLFINNHYIANDPQYGPEHSSIITLVFAALAGLALRAPGAAFEASARPWVIRVVRSVSPVMLVGGLLIVALFMIRIDYAAGVLLVLVSVVAYGARTTLSQVGHIERGETLQRERIELQSIALTDALTGVANRRSLEQALGQAAPPGGAQQPLAVLMIDIDHFKLLNDRLGHAAGDGCLRQVAGTLQRALGRPGDILARYGGEEFVALLHGADATGAAVVAERLRAAVERLQLAHPDSPFGVVTVSVGTASATAPEGLIAAADKALYAAKAAGRNRVRG